MGVPKFFRWISERYPLCSQLISDNLIPEFDNLYLDMNGIIHACSHPSDGDAHFRITETQIFLNIFNYIEHLFYKIRPKKLFFLAVDGVAPRAKMNQQRARRFRSAKDAAELKKKALARGEVLPDEAPFDSNCITPGTEFMTKLSAQLKYFISKKVNEDANWRDVEVVLSGHEVPGEGEHKIMEYLRLAKSRDNYDSNTRHCLYGLDADLIMLGLLSHEPHFALLREEVTFGRGKKKTSATNNPETQHFYLMHLSLMREYLDKEFLELRDTLPFPYDLERLIDDFILMAFFVGNDFLPNLPGLHINEGALATMFDVYKRVMPGQDGYLNEFGVMNLPRCQAYLDGLGDLEKTTFESEQVDSKWLRGKTRGGDREDHGGRGRHHQEKPRMSVSKVQKTLFEDVKMFVLRRNLGETLDLSDRLPAKDRAFVKQLAKELGVRIAIEKVEGQSSRLKVEWSSDEETETEDESDDARARVLRKYEKADVVDEEEEAALGNALEQKRIEEEFRDWKASYYKEKMNIGYPDSPELKKLVYHYVEGLQWVLYYYYNGVVSWGWFFPYHYAPKITDIVGIADFKFNFEKGTPFHPFEQLMGVLPAGSKSFVPPAFRELMTDFTSPIIDFYPEEFELDMNGKKADWEAIVKIPFIDETRLLAAMRNREQALTKEERSRNAFGESWRFFYDGNYNVDYPSSLPGIFPDIISSHCRVSVFHLPVLGDRGFIHGLLAGTRLGVAAMAGFPSLYTIPHTSTIAVHGVNVFSIDSKNPTVVLTLDNRYEGVSVDEWAKNAIGTVVYTGWPFLVESKVVSVSDPLFRYDLQVNRGRRDVVKTPHTDASRGKFERSAAKLEEHYDRRYAAVIGPVEVVVEVLPVKGMKRFSDGSLKKDFPPPKESMDVALQTVVMSVQYADPRFKEHGPLPVAVDFPAGCRIFFMGKVNYGCAGEVVGHDKETMTIRLLVPKSPEESDIMLGRKIVDHAAVEEQYMNSRIICKMLGMSALALSKITSSLHVVSRSSDQRYNLGLNLKFDSKGRKVLGYSRKSSEQGWEYSTKAVELIRRYKDTFPEFFAGIERKSRSDMYEENDFYPKDVAAAKMGEIRNWLKAEGVRDLESVPLDNESLTKDYIMKIESVVDDLLRSRQGQAPHFVTVKNVPRTAVLKPSHAVDVLKDQKFRLGDRVIFVQDSGSVPFANRGTVVGIGETLLDVVFDRTFITGINLGGRSSDYRSMSVPNYSVLNLTTQQPPFREAFAVDSEGPHPNLNKALDSAPRPSYSPVNNAPRPNAWVDSKARPGEAPRPPSSGQQQPRPADNARPPRPQAAAQPNYGRPAGGVQPPNVPSYGRPRAPGQFENYGRPPPGGPVQPHGTLVILPRPQAGPVPVVAPRPPAPVENLGELTGGLKSLLGISGQAEAAPAPATNGQSRGKAKGKDGPAQPPSKPVERPEAVTKDLLSLLTAAPTASTAPSAQP